MVFKGVEASIIPFPQSIYGEVPDSPPQDLNLGISPPMVRDLPDDPRDGRAFIYILSRSTEFWLMSLPKLISLF